MTQSDPVDGAIDASRQVKTSKHQDGMAIREQQSAGLGSDRLQGLCQAARDDTSRMVVGAAAFTVPRAWGAVLRFLCVGSLRQLPYRRRRISCGGQSLGTSHRVY